MKPNIIFIMADDLGYGDLGCYGAANGSSSKRSVPGNLPNWLTSSQNQMDQRVNCITSHPNALFGKICIFMTRGVGNLIMRIITRFFMARWFSLIDRTKLLPRIKAPTDWSGLPSLLKGLHELQGLGNWSEAKWDEFRATYYGMCACVDTQFGMALDALKEKRIYEETADFVPMTPDQRD